MGQSGYASSTDFMVQHAQVLFMSTMVSVALFLWLISLVTLAFALVYAIRREAEPIPLRRVARDDLPRVTVQLPICNEGVLAERIIRSAAALDYPADRLEIQVLDDSNDATSAIIESAVADVRRERPMIDVAVIRRHTRTRFKAGALQQGVAVATGE